MSYSLPCHLGELFVGMIYGAPLADILEQDWEAAFTAVGYVGLIILVLEGRHPPIVLCSCVIDI